MKLRTDDRGRIACLELFPPNALFNAEKQSDGSIRVVGVLGQEVPVVQPIRTPEGFLMLPVKLDRREVAASIRDDRNNR